MACYRCNQPGHDVRNCPTLRRNVIRNTRIFTNCNFYGYTTINNFGSGNVFINGQGIRRLRVNHHGGRGEIAAVELPALLAAAEPAVAEPLIPLPLDTPTVEVAGAMPGDSPEIISLLRQIVVLRAAVSDPVGGGIVEGTNLNDAVSLGEEVVMGKVLGEVTVEEAEEQKT